MSENHEQEQRVPQSNYFEDNPSDQRNDLIDSGVGFVVTFGFFMTVWVIFVIFEVIRDFT